jgi:hypothetical protein
MGIKPTSEEMKMAWIIDRALYNPGFSAEDVADHPHREQGDWHAVLKREGRYRGGLIHLFLQFTSLGIPEDEAQRIVKTTLDALNASEAPEAERAA